MKSRTDRPAFTLVEALAATALMVVVFAGLVPMVASYRMAASEQDAAILAVDEVHNVLERTRAEHQAGRFRIESLENLETRPELTPLLGPTTWSAESTPQTNPPGQQITVTLAYGKRHRRTVSLSSWLWENTQ